MYNHTSRRALIGGAGLAAAMVAIPAAAFPSGGDQADRIAWDAAVTNYQRARATWNLALAAFNHAEVAFYADRNDATSAGYDRAETESDRLSDIDTAAMRRVNDTPAPDLKAAIYKLELAHDYVLPMEPVLADLRRLSSREG